MYVGVGAGAGVGVGVCSQVCCILENYLKVVRFRARAHAASHGDPDLFLCSSDLNGFQQ